MRNIRFSTLVLFVAMTLSITDAIGQNGDPVSTMPKAPIAKKVPKDVTVQGDKRIDD